MYCQKLLCPIKELKNDATILIIRWLYSEVIVKSVLGQDGPYRMTWSTDVINRGFSSIHIVAGTLQGAAASKWSYLLIGTDFFFPLTQCPICEVKVLTAAHCWLQIFWQQRPDSSLIHVALLYKLQSLCDRPVLYSKNCNIPVIR